MSLGTIFNLGGGEVILVLALVLIVFGARNLPSFHRTTRTELVKAERDTQGHPVLMGITIILGLVCVALVLYEILK
jgi:hypothetical protein